MKRRALFPLISILAAILAFAGWGVIWMPQVKAQNKAAQPKTQAVAGQPGGNTVERIARLEQRILDMQTVIATLQSFVANGAGAPGPASGPGGSPPAGGGAPSEVNIRVLALETQIRALTGQMGQISEKLNQIADSAGAPPLVTDRQSEGTPQPQAPVDPGQFASSVQPAPQFGTTATLPPASPLEQALQAPLQSPSAPQAPPEFRQSAQLPPLGGAPDSGAARGVYDASYENFLRNDLQAAEQGFRSFVKTYPDDPLASNAYYWLGRSLFDRRDFEPAAKAFLAGYKKDKQGAMAPDALLHLGMSLAQLGEKDAACSTLGAIGKQFPQAPDKLRRDVTTALKRARC